MFNVYALRSVDGHNSLILTLILTEILLLIINKMLLLINYETTFLIIIGCIK